MKTRWKMIPGKSQEESILKQARAIPGRRLQRLPVKCLQMAAERVLMGAAPVKRRQGAPEKAGQAFLLFFRRQKLPDKAVLPGQGKEAELVPGPCDADIEEPSLFLIFMYGLLLCPRIRAIVRCGQDTVHRIQQVYALILQALGGMDGGEHYRGPLSGLFR